MQGGLLMRGSRADTGVPDVPGLGAHTGQGLCWNRQVSQTQGGSLVPPRPLLCDESAKRVQGGDAVANIVKTIGGRPARARGRASVVGSGAYRGEMPLANPHRVVPLARVPGGPDGQFLGKDVADRRESD